MASSKFQDADRFVISFAGNRIQGFADGEFLTYEVMTPGFQSVVGTDGEVARSKSNDPRVKITIKLLQTSASNAVLSAIHALDLAAPNGAGVAPYGHIDLNGRSILVADQAWITKYPAASQDRTAKSRDWELEAIVRLGMIPSIFEGGN